ncbi:hypothetical protein AGOR_G00180500 [Albula goreensis]|uniref:Uncharacterized protein n=1 Tax=Albula goreensis TaxID=1534307 RepID=A0A8T3CUF8_9TELE|nr:hypothetical protein AGOR_G00180500 [Albula goreensis]
MPGRSPKTCFREAGAQAQINLVAERRRARYHAQRGVGASERDGEGSGAAQQCQCFRGLDGSRSSQSRSPAAGISQPPARGRTPSPRRCLTRRPSAARPAPAAAAAAKGEGVVGAWGGGGGGGGGGVRHQTLGGEAKGGHGGLPLVRQR